MRIRADLDPDPSQTFGSQKVEFYMHNLKVVIGQKTYPRRYNGLFERQTTRFICRVRSITMFLDPDPDPHS
jgi:hypothetical protein